MRARMARPSPEDGARTPGGDRGAPMDLIAGVRRFFHRMAESDEQRYAGEIEAWASNIPGSVRIRDAATRTRVKLAGVVRRITVVPLEGHEALEVLGYDGTGEITVVWMGRRSIHGLTLGTRLVVEGMTADTRGQTALPKPR